MPPVVLIGLGLDSEKGITVQGLEEARMSDKLFAEFYTNPMPNLNMQALQKMVGRKITVLSRTQLEDKNAEEILRSAENGRVALFVPGDPMIATTHVSLRLALAKRNIPSRIVHGASIVSAICGATGLQSFKFGKSVTLPAAGEIAPSSVIETLRENIARGLHTLLLLDVLVDKATGLTINEGLGKLTSADSTLENRLAVGAARVGALDENVRAGKTKNLQSLDFGKTPHSLVFPGRLHFMEKEALRLLDGATDSDLEDAE
jgi:diphthine synthase